MEDVEEVDDNIEFNPYSIPDPEVVRLKADRRKYEEQDILKSSENQKLLKDALQDLSGDESPPAIPKRSDQVDKVPSQLSVGSRGSQQSFGSNKVGLHNVCEACTDSFNNRLENRPLLLSWIE